ncbi:hypothetical protein [Clostridium sp.]|uniref:hypothetical protein n=1 Tax=Clostridium sp. TaxID=1506 RepID=UPI00290A2BF4|nr:hypothetical protein [Clostridium sp.]MDU7364271.1 hypothetical protein [Clostridium sp.]
MIKEINTKLMTIKKFINDLKLINIDTKELEKYDSSYKISAYDILDEKGYFIDNLYEVVDDKGNIVAYYKDKNYKIIKNK